MSENRPDEESLRDEFETLGRNLIDALRSAWEAPESRRLREEVTTGLSDLGSTLKREAENLSSSPAAQKVQTSVEGVGEKLRAPEVQDKVRRELIGALQVMNTELQKVIDRWSAPGAGAPETAASGESAPAQGMGEAMDAPAPDQPGFPAGDFSQPLPGHNEVRGFDSAGESEEPGGGTPDDNPSDPA